MPERPLSLLGARRPGSPPPSSSSSPRPPKAKRCFDIDSLLAKPEPPRRSLPEPALWAALASSPAPMRLGFAAGLLPFPAVFLAGPPPPPPALPLPEAGAAAVGALFSGPLRPCAQPDCPRPGLDFPHCSPVVPISWRTGASCKMKRVRTVFTPEQLEQLEKEFLKQQYMVGTERVGLAATLHLTETQVKVWFQNRRIKWRKQSLEQKAAKLSQFGTPHTNPSGLSKQPEEVEAEP